MSLAQRSYSTPIVHDPRIRTVAPLRSTPAERAPSTQRAPVAPPIQTRVQSRREIRIQTRVLALMLLCAAVVTCAGIAYLSGYASLTREAYGRAYLRKKLNQEIYLSKWWSNREAVASAPAIVEQRASQLGMQPADDSKTLVLK